ncbi:MAG: hypothetical protein ACFFB0_16145 [Promethearchaeota archaeon]
MSFGPGGLDAFIIKYSTTTVKKKSVIEGYPFGAFILIFIVSIEILIYKQFRTKKKNS